MMRMRTAGASGTALVCLLVCLGGLLGGAGPARAGGLDVRRWLDRPGTRLMVVEFYATWCTPCMEAVPYWKALHEKYRDKGLRLVVVSTMDRQGQCVNPGWDPDQTVCDPEGVIAEAFELDGKLPAAFLWSWQGNLLVAKGHVGDVTAAVEAYLEKNPRVLVEARNHRGKRFRRLHDMVRAELSRSGKLTVVATRAERRALAEIRKESYRKSFDDKLQCELGREVSANSLLRAAVTGKRGDRWLSLNLFSAESACLLASAAAPYNHRHPARAVAEAIDRLLAKLKTKVQMPGAGAAVSGGGTEEPGVIGERPVDWQPQASEEVIVRFSSQPAGAVVLVDAELVCSETPCSRSVPKGRHLVSMQAEKHDKKQKRMLLKAGGEVAWELVPNYGWLTVRSVPAGLEVLVNDEASGTTPLERQQREPGKYQVLVRSDCHYDAGREVLVAKGKEQKLDLELQPKQGAVKVSTQDAKGNDIAADVFVDGKRLGKTPGTYKVSVCAQKLEVRHKKHGKATQDLEIRERKVKRLRLVLKGGGGDLEWVHSRPAGLEFTKSEITVAQYRSCVEAGRCTKPRDKNDNKYCNCGYSDRARHPINCIDWNQAKAVCEWAGGRLPTEQEWEAEASNKGRREYPWGGEKPSCDRAIWKQGGRGCGRDSTWPVCSKPAGNSVSGLCDMAGNVWEWTSSWYDKKLDKRVLRGGSWSFGYPESLRAADRHRLNPSSRYNFGGVRCVRSSR